MVRRPPAWRPSWWPVSGQEPPSYTFSPWCAEAEASVRSCVPPWNLAVVLEALCRPPFEPIEEISDRHLTIKTAFLSAISSLKKVGDLQALSVAPSYLDFAPGLAKVFLYPRAGYVSKVPSFTPRPVVLQAFCPPPFREPDQQKINCMCPVRALDAYVHRAALWRRADQLLVCYGPPKRGLPASTFTFMHLADAFIQSDLHCIQVTVLHFISSCFPWESNPWSWRC